MVVVSRNAKPTDMDWEGKERVSGDLRVLELAATLEILHAWRRLR